MNALRLLDLFSGAILIALLVLVILAEWFGVRGTAPYSAGLCLALLALFTPRVPFSRQVFVAFGLILAFVAWLSDPLWLDRTVAALRSAAFIAAFLTALTALRNVAETSESIRQCGRFLARQRPGRRYLALTFGGHLFALLLSYGSMVLLGHIVKEHVRKDENPEIAFHRTKRMLLAIQRGFVSTLPWSPLALAVAISTTIVPGSSWSGAVPACLVSAVILFGTGWALDTIFKPRISGPLPPSDYPEGGWSAVLPLLVLLAVLGFLVVSISMATEIRAVAVVLVVVPAVSIGWAILQNANRGVSTETLGGHVSRFLTADLPGFRAEFVLIMMAGFIGSLGSVLLRPLMSSLGLDLHAIPGQLILVAVLWLIPLAGQIGMNPIMSVSIMAPLIPPAAEIGVDPNAIIVAITSGWALAGASSPFTATTVFIGAMGGVSASRVGLDWNGPYTIICGILLSLWIVILT